MHKKANHTSKSSIKSFVTSIYPQTLAIMNAMLFPLSIAFVYIFLDFLRVARTDIVIANDTFAPIFDHLMVTLMIILCGSALLDVTLRETE